MLSCLRQRKFRSVAMCPILYLDVTNIRFSIASIPRRFQLRPTMPNYAAGQMSVRNVNAMLRVHCGKKRSGVFHAVRYHGEQERHKIVDGCQQWNGRAIPFSTELSFVLQLHAPFALPVRGVPAIVHAIVGAFHFLPTSSRSGRDEVCFSVFTYCCSARALAEFAERCIGPVRILPCSSSDVSALKSGVTVIVVVVVSSSSSNNGTCALSLITLRFSFSGTLCCVQNAHLLPCDRARVNLSYAFIFKD
jgi:hypothetical protein